MLFFKEWLIENQEISNYLAQAAQSIAQIVKDKTIVILGRDAWPLVPLLRHMGIKTQYFLYSRLQIGDKTTKEIWLKEVPKGSYVLDTGYMGSIIDDIKKFDPSIKGLLLSSNTNKYSAIPTNLSTSQTTNIVDDIEKFPKIIDRSNGFRGFYATTKKRRNKDDDVDDRSAGINDILNKNQELLKSMNLPDEVVSKYKNFSGISPSQRLGHDNIVTHLMNVDMERDKEIKQNQEMEYKWQSKWNKIIKLAHAGQDVYWNWDNVPDALKSKLAKDSRHIYKKTKDELFDLQRELDRTPAWDKEHIKVLQDRIVLQKQQMKSLWKLVKPIYYDWNYGALDD